MAFRGALHDALKAQPGSGRAAVIFVHGFNTNFSEGLYRIAQISHDVDLPGVIIHYSWHSAANPMAYLYDQDSILFARDGLERLIEDVAAAGADRILIVAHSIGASLAMEGMRQIALRQDRRTLDKISGVILISPDIDVDLFITQARAIGRLPQPFIIFTSNEDRALGLSASISGERARLGNLQDASRLGDLDVTLLEVGAFATGLGHMTATIAPELTQLLSDAANVDAAFSQDGNARVGLLQGAVLTVQNATQIILTPLAAAGQN